MKCPCAKALFHRVQNMELCSCLIYCRAEHQPGSAEFCKVAQVIIIIVTEQSCWGTYQCHNINIWVVLELDMYIRYCLTLCIDTAVSKLNYL